MIILRDNNADIFDIGTRTEPNTQKELFPFSDDSSGLQKVRKEVCGLCVCSSGARGASRAKALWSVKKGGGTANGKKQGGRQKYSKGRQKYNKKGRRSKARPPQKYGMHCSLSTDLSAPSRLGRGGGEGGGDEGGLCEGVRGKGREGEG